MDRIEHEWEESMAPMVFDGSSEVKYVFHCNICKARMICVYEEIKYMLDYPCSGVAYERGNR